MFFYSVIGFYVLCPALCGRADGPKPSGEGVRIRPAAMLPSVGFCLKRIRLLALQRYTISAEGQRADDGNLQTATARSRRSGVDGMGLPPAVGVGGRPANQKSPLQSNLYYFSSACVNVESGGMKSGQSPAMGVRIKLGGGAVHCWQRTARSAQVGCRNIRAEKETRYDFRIFALRAGRRKNPRG